MHKWPVVFETQRCLYRGHGLAPEEEWSGVGAGQGVYFRSGPQRSAAPSIGTSSSSLLSESLAPHAPSSPSQPHRYLSGAMCQSLAAVPATMDARSRTLRRALLN